MTIQNAQSSVLSTLDPSGRRLWLRPRLSPGRLLTARRIVAYILIVLFFALPWLNLNGHPAVLLDILRRRFHILGYTFLPTDTVLLAILLLILFVAIFLFTALLGRLWCGWVCPQTVYMEFLYRPLQRLFEGTAGRGGEPRAALAGWRKPAFFVAALVVTALPAHTFLAYFVGVENLRQWITGSPLQHPTAFLVMLATTLLMFFDFYWFREQMCVIACPYGRFQSVLLDKWSLIVSYDKRRGEPRAKLRKDVELPQASASGAQAAGDCIDCHLCVTTCPTGIDIREGLQMECVNCAQCIDACDAVMDKISRPRGLIRYSSQAAIDGEKVRFLRPRVILYPALLLVLIAVWVFVFAGKGSADVTLMRNLGNPFTQLPDGHIANSLRLKIQNRSDVPHEYTFQIVNFPDARLIADKNPLPIAGGKAETEGLLIEVPAQKFAGTAGRLDITLRITGNDGFTRDVSARLLGPQNVSAGP